MFTSNMSKYFRFALMAVLTVGLSFAATSCKDDDNSDNNGGQATAEEQAAEDANTFWGVAANLVSPFDVTDEYKNKTFEPTIGEAQEGSSTVRVVVVPDAEAAAANFAAIVDADVKESTTTYTYQNDAVGTLTYTKSSDGKSLAKVDVSIKQIPHLQQIVYKTQEQMGTNAVTDGVPYYSFGDVIKRTRADGVEEYWMCIQAPFTKQGETKAVWATLSKLPNENIWRYTASNGYIYHVPTKLGNNKEYMKNLGEMLLAMIDPAGWEQNLTDGPKGMKAFNLVKKENVKYINQYYWKRVADAWQNWVPFDLFQQIFGEDMQTVGNMVSGEGLKLLYYGYNWHTSWSNELSLYVSTVTEGDGSEANGRHLTWKEIQKNVIKPEKIEVDCLEQLRNRTQWINKDFFGDDYPRYIFRFATTKELAGTGAFESMNNIKGIQDVYVYTKKYNVTVGAKQKMDNTIVDKAGYTDNNNPITEKEVKAGMWIAASGDIYATPDLCKDRGGAVAYVVTLYGDTRVEKGKDYNGLAIALKPINSLAWAAATGACKGLTAYDDYIEAWNDYSGIANTDALSAGTCGTNHYHAAAQACRDYDVKVSKRGGAISNWFLPSMGQWSQVLLDLGGQRDGDMITGINNHLKDNGYDPFDKSKVEYYWTSTPCSDGKAWAIFPGKSLKTSSFSKTAAYSCLPFLAFKYGNGGTKDPELDDDDDDDDF